MKGTRMNEKQEPKKVLDMPSGVSSQGPVKDIGEAYLKAMIALPEIIESAVNVMDAQVVCMKVVADYFRKKGIDEKIFAPDDHKDLEELINESQEDRDDEKELA